MSETASTTSPPRAARRRWLARAAATCLACLAAAAGHAEPDPQAILAASDLVRNPSRPFTVNITLIEFRGGKMTESTALAVHSKPDPATGQFRTLVRIVAPARDVNKLMLKNGNDLWFFDPASQASIRLSPQQRLLGQAANGDVVTVNLAKDYRAELAGEEEIVDGERVTRQAHKLTLEAAADDVTYHRVEMWVDRGNARPIKALFYAESGRLLKTAYYRKYQSQLGRERPTEVIIIDGLDPGWVTVMRYADYGWRELPDAWFQRDYLPRFKPE